ncbi:hypothetical protein BaRGS_00037240 [Batillaria attramentaria]|uniref:Cytochrome P450 n=1 Tax=Batillaria attramentaria TaxID=370345 RepID=A0ABD0JA92_9CAEN
MVPAIERVVKNLQNYIKSKAESGEEVELKHLCQCYAIDSIAGVAFGLQVDSLKDPNDPFIKHGKDFVNFESLYMYIVMLFPFTVPILRLFGITFPPQAANNFFSKVIGSALEDRRHEQKKYGDFLQLLVDAEREGEAQGPVDAEIDHGHHLKTSSHWTRKGLTTDEVYGNTLVFLIAGNETVNTVMSFTLFCLAANPDCLAKAQAEIDAKLKKKPVNYDTAMELTYLDMCLNETMRLYPSLFVLDRQIAEDMEFGGYHIKKGWRIAIPAFTIHRDPAIWPDPLKFDPERFTPEARATRHPYAFMPFGLGPRNCIGMRLGQLEIRMAIATILQHFTPVLCDKSVYPPKLQKLTMGPVDGLWVTDPTKAVYLNPVASERAFVIKNQNGDWAFVVRTWKGFKNGVPGVKGHYNNY